MKPGGPAIVGRSASTAELPFGCRKVATTFKPTTPSAAMLAVPTTNCNLELLCGFTCVTVGLISDPPVEHALIATMKAAATNVVLDATAALSWFRPDEAGSPELEAALDMVTDNGAIVPGNFWSEVANALLRAERRHQLDATATANILATMLALEIRVQLPDPHFILTVSREHGLTCYDGAYLALALQRRTTLNCRSSVAPSGGLSEGRWPSCLTS